MTDYVKNKLFEYINNYINVWSDEVSDIDTYKTKINNYISYDLISNYMDKIFNENNINDSISNQFHHFTWILNQYLNDEYIDNETKVNRLKLQTPFTLNCFLLSYALLNDDYFLEQSYQYYKNNVNDNVN